MSNSQVGFFAVYDNGRGINVISVALVNNIYRKYLTVGKREPVTIEIIRKIPFSQSGIISTLSPSSIMSSISSESI